MPPAKLTSPKQHVIQGARSALSLNNLKVRSFVIQIAVVTAVCVVGWFLVTTTQRNLDLRGIATGFGFLNREAGIPIGEAVVPYAPTDVYQRALLVGLLNTVKVTVIGVILATVLGTIVGIAQLSDNWLLSRISRAYVEVTRDIPLLLQLLFWYTVLQGLPPARDALALLPGTFLSNRGLYFPAIGFGVAHYIAALALVLAGSVAVFGSLRRSRTLRSPWLLSATGLLVGAVVLIFFGGPISVELPALIGFNFRGGGYVSPEFFALLFGLVVYTTAFIAEIVRAGILAVGRGQWEAGLALGLSRTGILAKIVVPQALRIIVPPLTSQYVNLTKNSSLAVAIGYQDIVSIANTTLNQTGQAIEVIAIIMAAYLTVTLSISFLMNWYDSAIQLKGR